MCLKSTETVTSQICETFSCLYLESLAIHLFLSPLKLTHLETNPKSCKGLDHRLGESFSIRELYFIKTKGSSTQRN